MWERACSRDPGPAIAPPRRPALPHADHGHGPAPPRPRRATPAEPRYQSTRELLTPMISGAVPSPSASPSIAGGPGADRPRRPALPGVPQGRGLAPRSPRRAMPAEPSPIRPHAAMMPRHPLERFPSPSGSPSIAGAGGQGPGRGTRQDVESALSAHGRAVSAPRLTREAQGSLLGAPTRALTIAPVNGLGEAEPGLHSASRAGRASPGAFSLVRFFAAKQRNELARRAGGRNPTPFVRPFRDHGPKSGAAGKGDGSSRIPPAAPSGLQRVWCGARSLHVGRPCPAPPWREPWNPLSAPGNAGGNPPTTAARAECPVDALEAAPMPHCAIGPYPARLRRHCPARRPWCEIDAAGGAGQGRPTLLRCSTVRTGCTLRRNRRRAHSAMGAIPCAAPPALPGADMTSKTTVSGGAGQNRPTSGEAIGANGVAAGMAGRERAGAEVDPFASAGRGRRGCPPGGARHA